MVNAISITKNVPFFYSVDYVILIRQLFNPAPKEGVQ
jgi:hypothetical protein